MALATKPKIEAEIYSDLACPWCYAGYRRITKAIEQLNKSEEVADVDITWHAFLLDPNFHSNHPSGEPIDEYVIEKFGPNALSMKDRVIASGTPDGATFSSWAWRANTFPGHRLVALAKQQGKTHQANSSLFEASYEKGENISDLNVLIRIGRELELPNVEEWMHSDEGSLEVLKDFSEARQLGVTGVPAFFIKSGQSQTYALSGAQPVDVFVETFDRVLKER
jgi:predicted DsbA family dithiol-disulfide isomerase